MIVIDMQMPKSCFHCPFVKHYGDIYICYCGVFVNVHRHRTANVTRNYEDRTRPLPEPPKEDTDGTRW